MYGAIAIWKPNIQLSLILPKWADWKSCHVLLQPTASKFCLIFQLFSFTFTFCLIALMIREKFGYENDELARTWKILYYLCLFWSCRERSGRQVLVEWTRIWLFSFRWTTEEVPSHSVRNFCNSVCIAHWLVYPYIVICAKMGTSVEIILNRESKSYWAGELITGKVIVESDDEKNLKLIKGIILIILKLILHIFMGNMRQVWQH